MDDYVSKPIDAELLRKVIEKWVGTLEERRRDRLIPGKTTRSDGEATTGAAREQVGESGSPEADAIAQSDETDAESPAESGFADLGRLRELAEGDSAILERLINLFLDDAEEHGQLLEDAIRSNDSKAVESEAHRIKGGAGQVGAQTLQELAAELERMGREAKLEHAEKTFEEYEREYIRVSGYLRAEIES